MDGAAPTRDLVSVDGPDRSVSSDAQLEFLEVLVEENASIAGDVVEIREDLWAIHGFIPVDGDVLMAEFETYEQAATVLEELPRRSLRPDED